jgi:hypothetical protein
MSSRPKLVAPTVAVESQEDLAWKEAIRNLEPIMSGQMKFQYESILHPKQDAALYKKGAEVREFLDHS